jgi:hypothetical protein
MQSSVPTSAPSSTTSSWTPRSTTPGRSNPPVEGVIYRAFVDAAGGGPDSYTLAIGHKEGDAYVADVVRGTASKFDPQSVTEEYAALCRQYRVRTVVGDNYARDWVAGAWRKLGFEYIRAAKPKGSIYLEALPVFTRGLARLPDHTRLIREAPPTRAAHTSQWQGHGRASAKWP